MSRHYTPKLDPLRAALIDALIAGRELVACPDGDPIIFTRLVIAALTQILDEERK